MVRAIDTTTDMDSAAEEEINLSVADDQSFLIGHDILDHRGNEDF